MDNSLYQQEVEYDEFETYQDQRVTSVGLSAGQMALIIGVNAVISLVISVAVVLIAGRQVAPGGVASVPEDIGTQAATVSAPEIATTIPTTNPESSQPNPTVTRVESVTYEVQAGDTLSVIAGKFSVSLYDLMVANGLSDENFIQVGQVLVIPLGGLPTTTPTFTPVPQPTATPLPFDPPTPVSTGANIPPEPAATVGPSATPGPTNTLALAGATPEGGTTAPDGTAATANVVISEVVGAGELAQETLIILNQGTGTSLLNWKLTGSSLGNFVFPDIFLFSGGSIRVHTVVGQNTPSDLYLGQGEAAWPSGTDISLVNENGIEVSSFTVP
jgi:LysM repeat protein